MPVKYPKNQKELDEQVWVEITEERWWELLGAVPPFKQELGAFALGEEWCHTDAGEPVALMFCVIETNNQKRYFQKPDKLSNFNPKLYREQIRTAFNLDGQTWAKTEVDWKGRYEQLADLTGRLLNKLQEVDFQAGMIRNHLDASKRLKLDERGVYRFMQLKEDVTVKVEYVDRVREMDFPAGTLIDCDEHGHVYLDDNGDGNIYFPPKLLEPVVVGRFDPNLDKVVWQG